MEPEPEVDIIGWAKDVMFAAERIKKTTPGQIRGRPPKNDVKTCPAGVTDRQFDLWKIGRDDPNMLMKTMFPRAFATLASEREKALGEEVAEYEAKSIDEIEKLLAAAVKESRDE